MALRSDLAVEQIQPDELPDGVTVSRRGRAFRITDIVIENDSCRETLGKGKGRYITLEGGSLSRFADNYEDMAAELAEELRRLIPDGEVLVVGLGNRDITPDAIGPRIAERVLATRHLRDELTDEEAGFLTSLRRVSALTVILSNGISCSISPNAFKISFSVYRDKQIPS